MTPQALANALARTAGDSSDYDLNPGLALTGDGVLRPAAVLVVVWNESVILTKRASHLKHHPGQIAFPGGKVDAGDAGPEAAALREAREEIGLEPARVAVIGRLATHETVTGFHVVPVVAHLEGAFDCVAEPGEVAEVFTVPLAYLVQPKHYRIEGRYWRGQFRRYYAVPYGPYYIWGATARILRGLADRLAER